MAKYYGVIGFTTSIETVPGIWEDQIIEKTYRGDILQNNRKWQTQQDGAKINDNLQIDNLISILADAYAYQNIPHIKYITWLGNKWKILKAEINRPRIIFTIGEVYNA